MSSNPLHKQIDTILRGRIEKANDKLVKELVEDEKEFFENPDNLVSFWSKVQDISERRKYAGFIFWFVVSWLVITATIVILTGCQVMKFDPGIIKILITTTMFKVLGLFYIVASYLFPKPKGNEV